MKKLNDLFQQLRFGGLITRRALARLRKDFKRQPVKVWFHGLRAFLAGCIRIEDMPGRVQNQALNICFLERQKLGYTWFRWKSLNRLAMYFGPNYSCYDFFIVENELD